MAEYRRPSLRSHELRLVLRALEESQWGPPLRLERLEASGTFAPQRPKRTGLIRGVLFGVPVFVALWVALWMML